MKGSHICVTSPSYMRRLAGPASCSYRTLGLMLLFKGVCCTLTVHMAREVLTTAQIQCLFCSVLPASPLFTHLVYILYIKFSKKSKNKRSNSLRTAPITFALIYIRNFQNHYHYLLRNSILLYPTEIISFLLYAK